MLSPRALTVPGIGGTWCAVRCKPRNEKSLALDMLRAGFDYFLPLVRRVDNWRHVTYSPPTFLRGLLFASSQDAPEPGYAVPTALHYFLHDHHAFYGLIPVASSAQAQFQRELQEIHFKIVTGEITDNMLGFAVVGQVCKIRDGAYQGQTVAIERIVSPNRVVVGVVTMGDTRSLEVDARALEPVGSN
jgi:hypothetical protein